MLYTGANWPPFFLNNFSLCFGLFTFVLEILNTMANFNLNSESWEKVKIKFLRKYRELAKEDLQFNPGQEDELVEKLMRLVDRDRNYIEYTIKKALADPHGNRL